MYRVTALLEDDHSELHKLLEAARSAIRAKDLPRAFAETDMFWARLAMHIRAEHLHLFPFARRVAGAEIGGVLDELRRDHDMFMVELARCIKALRLAFHFGNENETFATVGPLFEKVAARLAIHDTIEEGTLYPSVDKGIETASDAESLRRALLKELENIPPRFLVRK